MDTVSSDVSQSPQGSTVLLLYMGSIVIRKQEWTGVGNECLLGQSFSLEVGNVLEIGGAGSSTTIPEISEPQKKVQIVNFTLHTLWDSLQISKEKETK